MLEKSAPKSDGQYLTSQISLADAHIHTPASGCLLLFNCGVQLALADGVFSQGDLPVLQKLLKLCSSFVLSHGSAVLSGKEVASLKLICLAPDCVKLIDEGAAKSVEARMVNTNSFAQPVVAALAWIVGQMSIF